ncbi:LysR family transcriptional regulator [Pseudarthrobacter sp. NPDC055928]|uniref:LysR family transcriptional regulator n=1 Tax=Pseudarthrobacter sp. NPDC055928 TaxID=3345661 RepID=UPI0035E389E4
MTVHLDWIESLVGVVDQQGFFRAGLVLGRSQSRVSTQVQNLERELGSKLIDRTTRPVTLTAAGEVFIGRARDILREVQAARAEIAALGGAAYGTVRIAVPPSIAGLVLPGLLDRFRRSAPNVLVEVVEGATGTLAAQLLQHVAVLALVPRPYVESVPEIEYVPLWREALYLLVAPTHRLADRQEASIRELNGETVITPGSGDGAQGISPEVAPFLADVVPAATRRVASPNTLASLVRVGLGVGVMSRLGLDLTGVEGIRIIRITEPQVMREIVLARRKDLKPTPARVEFERFLRSAPVPHGAEPV